MAARAFAAFRANPSEMQALCFAGGSFLAFFRLGQFRLFAFFRLWFLAARAFAACGASPLLGLRLALPGGQEAAAGKSKKSSQKLLGRFYFFLV